MKTGSGPLASRTSPVPAHVPCCSKMRHTIWSQRRPTAPLQADVPAPSSLRPSTHHAARRQGPTPDAPRRSPPLSPSRNPQNGSLHTPGHPTHPCAYPPCSTRPWTALPRASPRVLGTGSGWTPGQRPTPCSPLAQRLGAGMASVGRPTSTIGVHSDGWSPGAILSIGHSLSPALSPSDNSCTSPRRGPKMRVVGVRV